VDRIHSNETRVSVTRQVPHAYIAGLSDQGLAPLTYKIYLDPILRRMTTLIEVSTDEFCT